MTKRAKKLIRFADFCLLKKEIKPIILREAKKKKQIVYGATAMNAQLALPFRRVTPDIDLYTDHPKQAAQNMQRILDRKIAHGRDDFYATPAYHKGTYRVKHEGPDGKKRTKDDVEIADYTQKPKQVKTVTINGVHYEDMGTIEKTKHKTLRDKESEYRHTKDRNDLARIKGNNQVNSLRVMVEKQKQKLRRLRGL